MRRASLFHIASRRSATNTDRDNEYTSLAQSPETKTHDAKTECRKDSLCDFRLCTYFPQMPRAWRRIGSFTFKRLVYEIE